MCKAKRLISNQNHKKIAIQVNIMQKIYEIGFRIRRKPSPGRQKKRRSLCGLSPCYIYFDLLIEPNSCSNPYYAYRRSWRTPSAFRMHTASYAECGDFCPTSSSPKATAYSLGEHNSR